MPAPFQPMLLSPTPAPPAGPGWAHEAKLDGWRCVAEITADRVRLWSRTGNEWTTALPELQALTSIGPAVLDGELVAHSEDGRADFGLLGRRMHGGLGPAVTLYAFDLLALAGDDRCSEPWHRRHELLENLDLPERTDGWARAVQWTLDGAEMHEATRTLGLEGTVSKRLDSTYRPGVRSRAWLKAKHTTTGTFDVTGWRPTTSTRPGGLLLAEGDDRLGAATLALPERDRAGLVALINRYGTRHPTGTITIPVGAIVAQVRYTSRTPTHGLLREAVVTGVTPVQP